VNLSYAVHGRAIADTAPCARTAPDRAIGNISVVPDEPDEKRVERRADALTAEEQQAGSDDPYAQAEEILAESDARTEDRVSPPGKPVEHRNSEDTVDSTD
jgi:hypothetical protein